MQDGSIYTHGFPSQGVLIDSQHHYRGVVCVGVGSGADREHQVHLHQLHPLPVLDGHPDQGQCHRQSTGSHSQDWLP